MRVACYDFFFGAGPPIGRLRTDHAAMMKKKNISLAR